MNTPETDREQIEFCHRWRQKRTRRKFRKQLRKMNRLAREYYGKPMYIIFREPGQMEMVHKISNDIEIMDLNNERKIPE